jgi:hypothetical protein
MKPLGDYEAFSRWSGKPRTWGPDSSCWCAWFGGKVIDGLCEVLDNHLAAPRGRDMRPAAIGLRSVADERGHGSPSAETQFMLCRDRQGCINVRGGRTKCAVWFSQHRHLSSRPHDACQRGQVGAADNRPVHPEGFTAAIAAWSDGETTATDYEAFIQVTIAARTSKHLARWAFPPMTLQDLQSSEIGYRVRDALRGALESNRTNTAVWFKPHEYSSLVCAQSRERT